MAKKFNVKINADFYFNIETKNKTEAKNMVLKNIEDLKNQIELDVTSIDIVEQKSKN